MIFAIISPYYKKPAAFAAFANGRHDESNKEDHSSGALCADAVGPSLRLREKKQGDEKFVLNVSVCNVIDSLDPAMNTDADADSVFYALYENLMRESDDGSGEVTLTNGMAKEYTEETNYDGSVTYRFTLRSTARWSDGEKVTADDFVYAWQRLADPATDSPNHALMSVVAGYDEVRETGDKTKLQVSAKDESTFVVTLSAPCAYFYRGHLHGGRHDAAAPRSDRERRRL